MRRPLSLHLCSLVLHLCSLALLLISVMNTVEAQPTPKGDDLIFEFQGDGASSSLVGCYSAQRGWSDGYSPFSCDQSAPNPPKLKRGHTVFLDRKQSLREASCPHQTVEHLLVPDDLARLIEDDHKRALGEEIDLISLRLERGYRADIDEDGHRETLIYATGYFKLKSTKIKRARSWLVLVPTDVRRSTPAESSVIGSFASRHLHIKRLCKGEPARRERSVKSEARSLWLEERRGAQSRVCHLTLEQSAPNSSRHDPKWVNQGCASRSELKTSPQRHIRHTRCGAQIESFRPISEETGSALIHAEVKRITRESVTFKESWLQELFLVDLDNDGRRDTLSFFAVEYYQTGRGQRLHAEGGRALRDFRRARGRDREPHDQDFSSEGWWVVSLASGGAPFVARDTYYQTARILGCRDFNADGRPELLFMEGADTDHELCLTELSGRALQARGCVGGGD